MVKESTFNLLPMKFGGLSVCSQLICGICHHAKFYWIFWFWDNIYGIYVLSQCISEMRYRLPHFASHTIYTSSCPFSFQDVCRWNGCTGVWWSPHERALFSEHVEGTSHSLTSVSLFSDILDLIGSLLGSWSLL